jgi:RNA polymerase sigma-70 factor (sigma-E family)
MTTGGHDTASTDEGELSARLYRQITDIAAARYAATYDAGAGLSRFNKLLQAMAAELGREADPAFTQLYALHYRSLVRLAAMLVRDDLAAERVVQDAFVAAHARWDRLRNPEDALAYLRQAVVNSSRSVLRHRKVTGNALQLAPPDMPGSEHAVLFRAEQSAVLAALRHLPVRQREAIALRYYAGLSEAEIAAALGISRGAVKSHTARGMEALRAAREQ